MKRISFDGDTYFMTLPYLDGAKSLFYHKGDTNPELEFFAGMQIRGNEYTEVAVVNFLRYVNHGVSPRRRKDGAVEAYHLIKMRFSDFCTTARSTEYLDRELYFQPMLIPLDKDGEDISKQFKEENPNGTIVSGGTFLLNGGEIPASSPDLIYQSDSILELSDTGAFPVEWICWNGWLFAAKPILKVSLQDLHDLVEIAPYTV